MHLEDGLPDIPLEGGTVNTTTTITTSQPKTVLSSSAKSLSNQSQSQYISTIDDSKLVTVTSSISSTPSSTNTSTSSPVYSPVSSPRSPSSSSMDGISTLHHKRSRVGSISSHSSGSDTDDDERATKRHQSDSDVDSVASDETRTHEPIVTIKYGEHAIRVLTIEDGTRVVVAKDFLLLTGISKENCARTTKNLIEGKDKRMMHVPSSYCMNKGQQAVVLTASGLSQLLVTSRRLKQSAALQAWIKQTLMPALQVQGYATTATNTTNAATEQSHIQSQSQAHNKTNTNNTKSKNGRTIVKAKRSVASKYPSASPVVKSAPAPLTLSPTTSSFSPFIRSPSSSASSSPIRPTFSRLSSSDSESTMSDASISSSSSSSTPSSPASGMQELSAAADMMLITPSNMPLAKPLPLHLPMSMPFVPTFSRIHPSFPYRTPLMPLSTMAGMGIRPTFTHVGAGKMWAAGA